MRIPSNTVGIVLAGGVGSRLAPLTTNRAKPAVPFARCYRIIDFTLSNCLNSGLNRVLVLTQYQSRSLAAHVRDAWSNVRSQDGEFIMAVPPRTESRGRSYCGTADAVYQNLDLLERGNTKNVIILSGDHVYQMDYAKMFRQHEDTAADVTIACMEVNIDDARSFGVLSLGFGGRVREFKEKPPRPVATPDDPNRALASMGIYIFSAEVLRHELKLDHEDQASTHDFGKDILPRLIPTRRVHGYRPGDDVANSYWRDVGTVDAYFQASMDLLKDPAPINLHDPNWPMGNLDGQSRRIQTTTDSKGVAGEIQDAIFGSDVVIDGGSVRHSILSSGVHVGRDAVVTDSILFDDVEIGEGAWLQHCIVDNGVRIPAGFRVGLNPLADAQQFPVSDCGVVVIPQAHRFAPSERTPPPPGRTPLPAPHRVRDTVRAD